MKVLLLFFSLALLIVISSCDETSEESATPPLDSLTVKNEVLAGDAPERSPHSTKKDTLSFDDPLAAYPFNRPTNSLIEAKQLFGDSTENIISPTNATDYSVEEIAIRRFNSELYCLNIPLNKDHSLITSASIADGFLIFKKGITIGMHKKELLDIFPILKPEHLVYSVYEIMDGDATSYLYLTFENDRLVRVMYLPYTG